VVIVPAVVWYYNADFFWFLILDALTLVEVIFSAAKQVKITQLYMVRRGSHILISCLLRPDQARLERQSMAVQVKHVRMQVCFADHARMTIILSLCLWHCGVGTQIWRRSCRGGQHALGGK